LRHAHLDAAAELDAGYEDNTDLVIGEGGVPTLKRRRAAGTPKVVETLAEAIARRMPERSLLGIVARTAHWLGWHHHFGPASGSDPKISDPRGRYAMAVFTGGANLGPYEAAKHIAGVSAREPSMVRNRHIDLKKLNAAIATVINAFAELDVVRGMVAEGWTITAHQLAALSPYMRAHIGRFGAYATDELAHQPEAFNPVLKEVDFSTLDLAA
jgi:Tn3 transposase DDE domain